MEYNKNKLRERSICIEAAAIVAFLIASIFSGTLFTRFVGNIIMLGLPLSMFCVIYFLDESYIRARLIVFIVMMLLSSFLLLAFLLDNMAPGVRLPSILFALGNIVASVLAYNSSVLYKNQVKELQTKSAQGDMEAQYLYGILFKKTGKQEDSKLWLGKAAEQGHIAAKAELGDPQAQYEYALTLDDLFKKRSWLEKSAAQGYKNARSELQKVIGIINEKQQAEEAAEAARLASMPKCPSCGEPLERKYVNQYWGSRYICGGKWVSGANDKLKNICTWKGDNELSNPYKP